MQLHSAVVGRIQLQSPPLGLTRCSEDTAPCPSPRPEVCVLSAQAPRAPSLSAAISRSCRPSPGSGRRRSRRSTCSRSPRASPARCVPAGRPPRRPSPASARAGRRPRRRSPCREGEGGASARLPEMTRRLPESRRSPCRRGAPRRGRAAAGAGQPPSRRPPSPRTSPPSRMPSSGRTEARRLLLLPATARCSSRRASSAGGAAGCTGR